MKPSTHNDTEFWRRNDAALRSALQQRYADEPQLTEGFEERMLAALPSDISPTPAPSRQRRLWPFVAASLAAAALLTAVFFVPRKAEQDLLTETEVKTNAERPNVILKTEENKPASDVHAQPAKSVAKAKLRAEEPTINDPATLIIETDGNDAPDEIAQAFEAAEDSAKTATPAAEDFILTHDRLEELIARENQRTDNYIQGVNKSQHDKHKITAKNQPLIALAVHAGTDVGRIERSGNEYDDIDALNNRVDYSNPTKNEKKSDNYYFIAANGYTSDFSYDAAVKQNVYISSSPEIIERHFKNMSHSLPFTIGANISIPLSEQWFAETGLTYTRLISNAEEGASADYYQHRQRINYLGIPLRAQYRFYNIRSLTAYATAGGAIDFPVNATRETKHFMPGNQSTRPSSASVSAPVQFSTCISVGAQFNCNSHLGIFAEPSLQWFIPAGSDVETYRTEHPLQFVPTIGLRWTL